MKRSNQKGVALLMTLILVLVISVMAASMMFLAQSETLSSVNYRLMTQARYGAEAGLHAAANYLTNAATGYPGIGTSDPITAYNINVSPVTAGGNPVVLSSLSGVTANYPVTAVKTAFATLLESTAKPCGAWCATRSGAAPTGSSSTRTTAGGLGARRVRPSRGRS